MTYTIARVHVKRLSDPAEFLAEALPLLLSNEARANLVLGIAGTLRDRPEVYPGFLLWLVENEGAVVAAALRTPPHNLVLLGEPEAAAELADVLAETGAPLPGVTGNLP